MGRWTSEFIPKVLRKHKPLCKRLETVLRVWDWCHSRADTYVCILVDLVDTTSGMGFIDRFSMAAPYNLTATQLVHTEVQCSSMLGTVECGHVGE